MTMASFARRQDLDTRNIIAQAIKQTIDEDYRYEEFDKLIKQLNIRQWVWEASQDEWNTIQAKLVGNWLVRYNELLAKHNAAETKC